MTRSNLDIRFGNSGRVGLLGLVRSHPLSELIHITVGFVGSTIVVRHISIAPFHHLTKSPTVLPELFKFLHLPVGFTMFYLYSLMVNGGHLNSPGIFPTSGCRRSNSCPCPCHRRSRPCPRSTCNSQTSKHAGRSPSLGVVTRLMGGPRSSWPRSDAFQGSKPGFGPGVIVI